MILPIVILLFGGLLLYAGTHDMTVTDALNHALGRKGSGGPLGYLSGIGSNSANSFGASGANPILAGGKVKGHPELRKNISSIVSTILQQYPSLVITSTISGSHAQASYHYFGEACDIGGDPNTMNQAAQWIAANLTPVLTEGIHNPGLSVKNGKPVDPSFWGASTWAAHQNHIHVAAAQNSVSSPPGF